MFNNVQIALYICFISIDHLRDCAVNNIENVGNREYYVKMKNWRRRHSRLSSEHDIRAVLFTKTDNGTTDEECLLSAANIQFVQYRLSVEF